MVNRAKIFGVACAVVCALCVSAFSADWPAFHGADRTNKSTETGLLKEWPKDGPKLLWTASGLGKGYSGVSVSNGIVYCAGVRDNINYVFAFNNAGKLLWQKPAGGSWEGKNNFARGFEGSRSTPTVDGGVAYYLSDAARLTALDAKSGTEKWSVDLKKKYEPGEEVPKYAFSESPLIDGDRLYVSVYGQKAGAVCLDKNTGKVIWEAPAFNVGACDGCNGDGAYASFVLADNGGYRQLVGFNSGFVYGMDSKTGKTLWSVPFKNKREDNCTDAIFHDGHVFVSSGYGYGSMLVKLGKSGDGVAAQEVYRTKLMDNHHGGVILHNGYVYGSGSESKGWFCLDFKTGKQMWNSTPGKGSITFADGMLYLYDEDGTMTLAKAQPDKFTPVSSFPVPPGGKGTQYWAHPVVSNGVLYLRHADNLYAYDVKGK